MDPSELIIASGDREACQSTEGVFDMVGNLEEWVLDSWRGAEGMLEGGAWYTHTSYADCSGRYSRQPAMNPHRQAGFPNRISVLPQ